MDWPAPLTIPEVAAELRCDDDDVRALIRAGELRTVACGVRPGLVPRHQLEDYLRRHRPRIEPASRSSSPPDQRRSSDTL
jgi:excisionase family DNA binding protein